MGNQMTRPIIQIHNSQTDEVIFREMTDAEFAEHEQRKIEIENKRLAEEALQAQRSALLAKLGITEEEAKLLLS